MMRIIAPENIAAARRQSAAPSIAIEVVAKTGSTNADLMQRIGTLPLPTLRVALTQTAGRGRNGRVWHSEPDASLTFSLAWRFSRAAHELSGLPLAVGVAIAQALCQFGVLVRLKWPNDVLKSGKKLAGVLIEMPAATNDKDGTWAVIGIGLNLNMPDRLESRIDQPAAAAPWLAQMDRNLLMGALLDELSNAMTLFDSAGFAPFMQPWNDLHAHAGQEITIIDLGRGLHNGVAVGIDQTGRLLLDCVAGRTAISAGDVTLRAISGHEYAVAD